MLRQSTAANCREVYNLICDMEASTLDYEKFKSIYLQQLADANYYCLIYEEGGKTCGILNLRFEQQLHHTARIAEIMEFAVAQDYRNSGVGKIMFAEAVKMAKAQGCVQLEVACNQLRHNTHRFYLREGMHNFHFKFSLPLNGDCSEENRLGR